MPKDKDKEKVKDTKVPAGSPAPEEQDDDKVVKKIQGYANGLKVSGSATTAADPEGIGTGGMNITAGGARSGGAGESNPRGDHFRTPRPSDKRGETRYGKKTEKLAVKLLSTPCEQVEREYKEPAILAENPGALQGSDRVYKNVEPRRTKAAGITPAEIDYERSLDFIMKDKVYFGEGQQISSEEAQYPTEVAAMDNGEASYFKRVTKANDEVENVANDAGYDCGNFLYNNLDILIDSDSNIGSFMFDVKDLGLTRLQDTPQNSLNTLTDINEAEAVREIIEDNAGDPTDEKFSPLGRAVKQSDKVLALFRDFDRVTGSELSMAYTKASQSLSFQLNKAKKDGIENQRPALEAFLGIPDYRGSSSAYTGSLTDMFSGNTLFDSGNAAVLIKAFDSVTKYKDKSDIALLPRSLHMHLNTASKVIGNFKVDSRFVQAVKANETFVAAGETYDPTLPILITDKAKVVHKLNFNQFGAFIKEKIRFKTYECTKAQLVSFNGDYHNRKKLIPSTFSSGFDLWMGYKGTNVSGTGLDSETLQVDTEAKEIDIMNRRTQLGQGVNNIDLVFSIGEGSDSTYSWHNITGYNVYLTINGFCESASGDKIAYPYAKYGYTFNDTRNQYFTEVGLPLVEGLIEWLTVNRQSIANVVLEDQNPAAPANLKKRGKIWRIPTVHSTMYFSLWSFLLCAASPWMLTSRSKGFRDLLDYSKNFEYPFNLQEAGFIDTVGVKYSGFEEPLGIGQYTDVSKISWVWPDFWTYVHKEGDSQSYLMAPWHYSTHDYDDNGLKKVGVGSIGFPVFRSGALLEKADFLYSIGEEQTRLALDRIVDLTQLGDISGEYKFSVVADGVPIIQVGASALSDKYALLKPVRTYGWGVDSPAGVCTRTVNTPELYMGSLRVREYFSPKALNVNTILAEGSFTTSRGSAYTQDWMEYDETNSPSVKGMIPLSHNDLLTSNGSTIAGKSSFDPFSINGLESRISMKYSFPAFWAYIQKSPFAINPLDASHGDKPANRDPYDLLYTFGFCGFIASDYSEELWLKHKDIVEGQIYYSQDEWVKKAAFMRV